MPKRKKCTPCNYALNTAFVYFKTQVMLALQQYHTTKHTYRQTIKQM
jgi:hypothetical protein